MTGHENIDLTTWIPDSLWLDILAFVDNALDLINLLSTDSPVFFRLVGNSRLWTHVSIGKSPFN